MLLRNRGLKPQPPATNAARDILRRCSVGARPPGHYMAAMADTALMPIAGVIDPVPVARDITPRADGRVDLIGLTKRQIAALFEEAGLDARQAKLRAKQ